MGDVRRGSMAVALALLGCSYETGWLGGGSSTGGGSSSGSAEAGESTKGAEGESTTNVVVDGSGTGSSGGSSEGSGSTGGSSSEDGDSTTGEPLPTARSCAEVLEQDPKAQTGVHPIVSTVDGTVVVEVWCEMELDEGGWTLVGRSANEPGVPFGWGVTQGEMENVSQAYSLGVMSLGMPFTEVLVGRRSGWAGVVENAYVITVPEGFLEDYREEPYETDTPRTVLGDCDPSGGPEMLQWMGYTENEGNFFFRDFQENHNWGLYPHEWQMLYDDCDRGGEMDDAQGAVFVR